MEHNNFYTVLGIKKSASPKEIKTAYRNLAKKHHPDKNQNNPKAEDYFKEVQYAYTILSNPTKRKLYDLKFGTALNNTSAKTYAAGHANPYQFSKAAAQAQKNTVHHAASKHKTINETPPDLSPLYISIVIALLLVSFIVLFKV